jgi:hypothetical protein
MVETIKLEWPKTELIHILRWEDDGGKIMETNHVVLDPPFVQPMPIHGARPDTSLPWKWNQQFVIEPFQADAGIRLIKRKTPIKKVMNRLRV